MQEESPLVKTIAGACPDCGGTASLVVSTYKVAVRTWNTRTFYCEKCGHEFSVPVEGLKFSVASAAD